MAAFLCSLSVLLTGCASERVSCPVFLEHYYEIALDEEGSAFELSYVTEKEYDSRPVEAELSGFQETGLTVEKLQPLAAKECGRYAIQTVRLDIAGAPPVTEVMVDSARIWMEDGTCLEGAIGKIVLFPERQKYEDKALSSERTWVSSADSSACDLYFSEDSVIIGMPSSLEEETDGILNTCYNPIPEGIAWKPGPEPDDMAFATDMEKLCEITGDSIQLQPESLPQKFSEKDHIMLISEIRIGEQDVRKYCRYRIARRFLLENERGETKEFVALEVNYTPSLRERDIINYCNR